jgi:hypothetical protein
MKKLLSLVIAMAMTGLLFAQTATIEEVGDKPHIVVEKIFGNLDKTPITTKRLLNRAIDLISTENFNGRYLSDSTDVSLEHFGTLAWTIAPGPAINDIGGQKVANIKNTNAMFIFPNPAEAYFKLVLPSGRYDVTVSDVLGRVIKQTQVADYEDISTGNIQSGLYQVTVRKQGEQNVFQTGKIVIKE